ncbi:MAG TPA: hypothetical protein EYQ20_16075, partial [candidate division Zixibacteria bacterium]|nr:hypothetical protein [candidate division Zixibacteria bacterium]
MPTTPQWRHYHELRPDELAALRDENPVAFWPLGLLEHHGWHLPVGFDGIKAERLCIRIAERTGETKVVTKSIIQMFLDEIIRELSSGNRLEFRDFGVFEVRSRNVPNTLLEHLIANVRYIRAFWHGEPNVTTTLWHRPCG